MLLTGKAGHVFEMTGMHPKLRRVLIHHFGEHGFGAGYMFGQCNTCVITRLHNHAEQQVLHRDPCPNLDKRSRAGCTPGLFADRYLVVESDLFLSQRRKNRKSRHELGQTGRRQALVGLE